MLTADTITDEQIRELYSTSRRSRQGERETAYAIRNLCDIALSDTWPAVVVREARRRCAEILNARRASEVK